MLSHGDRVVGWNVAVRVDDLLEILGERFVGFVSKFVLFGFVNTTDLCICRSCHSGLCQRWWRDETERDVV